MFLNSWKSIPVAAILTIMGLIQLYYGSKYADAAKREVSTVGFLKYVNHGKQSIYDFSFEEKGFLTGSITHSCRTALTPQGCEEGAKVLVYYDPEHRTSPMLEEFGAAGREKLLFGALFLFVGLALFSFHFVVKKMAADPDGPAGSDDDLGTDNSETLHNHSRTIEPMCNQPQRNSCSSLS